MKKVNLQNKTCFIKKVNSQRLMKKVGVKESQFMKKVNWWRKLIDEESWLTKEVDWCWHNSYMTFRIGSIKKVQIFQIFFQFFLDFYIPFTNKKIFLLFRGNNKLFSYTRPPQNAFRGVFYKLSSKRSPPPPVTTLTFRSPWNLGLTKRVNLGFVTYEKMDNNK